MVTHTAIPVIEKPLEIQERYRFPSLCWGAILGGTVAAIGIHILLSMLGVGAGMASFSSTADIHAAVFSEETAAIWSACALVALFFGSVIAGRFSQSIHGGFVHGILVWSLSLIIALLLLSNGTGMVFGGGLKALGKSLETGGNLAASAMSGVSQDGIKRSGNELSSFIDEAMQSVPTNSPLRTSIRAKREIGLAVAKLFAPENDINSKDNRAVVVGALVNYAQMSQADAQSTVTEWIASYESLQSELDHAKNVAEQKAKDIAGRAAHDLTVVGSWTFFGLLLGLIVSAGGGVLGADCAVKRGKTKIVSVP